MANTFYIADTHFGHKNILKFESEKRPFSSIEEHDETIVDNWNKLIKPDDIVYHLGDIAFGEQKDLKIIKRLNGHKYLIPGNHDNGHMGKYYTAGFEKILPCLVKTKGKLLLSHVPIHPSEFYSEDLKNVHGHIHGKLIMDPISGTGDVRYINVGVEWTNMAPIAHEDLHVLNEEQSSTRST